MNEIEMKFEVSIKIRFDSDEKPANYLRDDLIEYIMNRVADEYDEARLSDFISDMTGELVESAVVDVR